jgi:hypothetical protein
MMLFPIWPTVRQSIRHALQGFSMLPYKRRNSDSIHTLFNLVFSGAYRKHDLQSEWLVWRKTG